jgi:hypothetical protein
LFPCQVRFPDPERGVPDPGHGGDWFGHHMVISGSSFVPLALCENTSCDANEMPMNINKISDDI